MSRSAPRAGTTGTSRRRPGYLAAAAVFAAGMAGTTLPTPLYGLYRDELGFSELTVTLVFATYAAGVILTLLLAGNHSDTAGRRPVLLCALAFAAASAVCFLLEDGLPLLYAGRLLSGFSAGLLSGAGTVTVMELAPPGRRSRAGFAATAANMGGLGCGPLLAGFLAEYAPWPLTLPFLTHLALLAVAATVVLALPETVGNARPGARPQPQGLYAPPQVRGVFAPAAMAAFAGFSLLGLFTAVAPSFLAETLGEKNLAVCGVVVFTVFLASTGGQALTGRFAARTALPLGCLVLVAGLLLVGSSLWVKSLPLLVLGGVCGGIGQGLAFRSGLTAVGDAAPAAHRAATVSSFFVVAYAGISLPVIGVGALTVWLGLRDAGLTFTACVTALAAFTGAWLARTAPGRDTA
ncbi:MFS transporter [Streptomyces sp. t39]|uniref:MFS transporter n=1 Tax=Streptomyces sp. t39 TaxID=1828156 RepID=UPI0011CDE09F|nr:MFS transporter [Streptomyces sp. t39]TXS52967.1 MFS transporter [Streptomyces sp. t39]